MVGDCSHGGDRAWFSARGADRQETDVGVHVRALVERNVDFVRRSVRRLGVPAADVEDATQQVFIVAARKLEKFREGSERAYLFGIAVRVASDARRAMRRRDKAHQLFAVDFINTRTLSARHFLFMCATRGPILELAYRSRNALSSLMFH